MHKKLVGVFTVAGVLAAGTAAYAINSQALNGSTSAHVGVATADLSQNAVVSNSRSSAKNSSDSRNNTNKPVTPNASNSPVMDASPVATATTAPQQTQSGTSQKNHSGTQAVNGPFGDQPQPTPTTESSFPPIVPPAPTVFPNNGEDDNETDSTQGDGGHGRTNPSGHHVVLAG